MCFLYMFPTFLYPIDSLNFLLDYCWLVTVILKHDKVCFFVYLKQDFISFLSLASRSQRQNDKTISQEAPDL